MSTKKMLILLGTLVIAAALITACGGKPEPGPAGPAGPAGPQGPQGEPGPAASFSSADLTCTQCHNDTTLIWSKEAQFRERSVHGTGEAFERGENTSCAGCHGTEGAKARINAGLPPHDPSVEGVTNVSPFDCRTCHNIHTTYTRDDFSLTGGGQPVKFENTDGTFDGGLGNLCANCHQIRNPMPEVVDGNVTITSSRYGTHHGVEAQMLAGVGALGVDGAPSKHYEKVENTCVYCHMGDERNHTYEPDAARCATCHSDAANFDINGVQTDVTAMVEELKAAFIAKGLMNADNGLWVASSNTPLVVPEAVADAMWNYSFVTEDQSMGVHNSTYTKAMLQEALDAINAYTP